VFLSGLLLAPRYAMISQAVYIALGLLGLPVFSTGGGFSYILTPSFGFLLGFILCAGLLSLLARKELSLLVRDKSHRLRRFLRIAVFGLAAIIAMYAIGVTYMYMIYNLYLHDPRTIGKVVIAGTGIFVLIDIAKLCVALPIAGAVLKRLPFATDIDHSGTIKKEER
jgi:biotin transport system substrate-specific component